MAHTAREDVNRSLDVEPVEADEIDDGVERTLHPAELVGRAIAHDAGDAVAERIAPRAAREERDAIAARDEPRDEMAAEEACPAEDEHGAAHGAARWSCGFARAPVGRTLAVTSRTRVRARGRRAR